MAKPVFTNAQIIAQLNSGYHWSGSVITYGFPTDATWLPSSYAEKPGFSALNATQQSAAQLALELWDDLIAPTISQAANGSTANIKIANSATGVSYAQTYYPTGS